MSSVSLHAVVLESLSFIQCVGAAILHLLCLVTLECNMLPTAENVCAFYVTQFL